VYRHFEVNSQVELIRKFLNRAEKMGSVQNGTNLRSFDDIFSFAFPFVSSGFWDDINRPVFG